MKIRVHTILVLLLLLGFGCGSPVAPEFPNEQETVKPNILLIVSDDQRWDTMEAMPRLLEFMEQGTTFPQAYTTTPLCCPSRASLLTGLYAHSHGVLGNRFPYGFSAFQDDSTLATWLQDAGYKTALIGKYLNDYNSADADYLPPGWDQFIAFIDKPGYEEFSLTSHNDGTFGGITTYTSEDRVYSTQILAQEAVSFLTEASTQEVPFFLMFTPFAPHAPSTPPEGYSLSETFESVPSFNEEDTLDKSSWIQGYESLSDQEQRIIDRHKQLTYGALQGLDTSVQMIIEQLDKLSILENTIVIYTSDNGLHWGEHRIRSGKATPYEEAIRVPLFLYDGRNPVGKTDDRLMLLIDLAPTLATFTGIEIPGEIDGKSLGGSDPWREAFLVENFSSEEGTPSFTQVHTSGATYIQFENGEEELYDLVEDPYELENLIDDPLYAGLKTNLKEWLSSF